MTEQIQANSEHGNTGELEGRVSLIINQAENVARIFGKHFSSKTERQYILEELSGIEINMTESSSDSRDSKVKVRHNGQFVFSCDTKAGACSSEKTFHYGIYTPGSWEQKLEEWYTLAERARSNNQPY